MKLTALFISCIVLSIGLVGCEPADHSLPQAAAPSATGRQQGVVPAGASGPVAERIQALLRPWDHYDPAWESQATVIVLSRGRRVRYPCDFVGGVWSMSTGHGFTVQEVIKGSVAGDDTVITVSSGPEPNFPPYFVDGRTYLLLLRPGEETARRLNDPEDRLLVGPGLVLSETVAVIDLSKSRAEADAVNVQATRSGQYDGFEFTPARWRQLREADEIDLGAQSEFLPFLQNVVLVEGATTADIRSYLGEPDFWRAGANSFTCHYELNRQRPKPENSISGRLEIRSDGDTRLVGYVVVFYEHWSQRTEHNGYVRTSHNIRSLDDEELAALGLSAIEGSFR